MQLHGHAHTSIFSGFSQMNNSANNKLLTANRHEYQKQNPQEQSKTRRGFDLHTNCMQGLVFEQQYVVEVGWCARSKSLICS